MAGCGIPGRGGRGGGGEVTELPSWGAGPVRPPVRGAAVAGTFYPSSATALGNLAEELFTSAARLPDLRADAAARGEPLGILVPHAGLAYSGIVAAAGWSRLRVRPGEPGAVPLTVVILGTNHRAAWLDGVAAWEAGSWAMPAGPTAVDGPLAQAIVGLGPPFLVDRDAHDGEHSIEVQLPLLRAIDPDARIVPLAVSAGRGVSAIEAGARLGSLLAAQRAAGGRVIVAISTDMAHYPPADACEHATERLLPSILALDAAGLARREDQLRGTGIRDLACGMCGIDPAVLGLAALRAMGAVSGMVLATATSADAGGPRDRTVGYLAVRFDA
jgi:AmmeMemoRadiSam system protein B